MMFGEDSPVTAELGSVEKFPAMTVVISTLYQLIHTVTERISGRHSRL